jgi:hypothetical protein
MKMKPFYMTGVGVIFAGLFAIATVTPAVAARASLGPDPHHLNCGAEAVGDAHACGPMTFTNNTSTTVVISNLVTDDNTATFGVFTSGCLIGTQLAPGASCSFPVDFHPTQTGHLSATFTVSEDTFNTATTVRLGGRGTA